MLCNEFIILEYVFALISSYPTGIFSVGLWEICFDSGDPEYSSQDLPKDIWKKIHFSQRTRCYRLAKKNQEFARALGHSLVIPIDNGFVADNKWTEAAVPCCVGRGATPRGRGLRTAPRNWGHRPRRFIGYLRSAGSTGSHNYCRDWFLTRLLRPQMTRVWTRMTLLPS